MQAVSIAVSHYVNGGVLFSWHSPLSIQIYSNSNLCRTYSVHRFGRYLKGIIMLNVLIRLCKPKHTRRPYFKANVVYLYRRVGLHTENFTIHYTGASF